jgi:nucleoside-diphosphate-sugar epimerase
MDLGKLKDKSILITGATGLIGQTIVKKLLELPSEWNVKVVAMVRNKEKAEVIFRNNKNENFQFLIGDVLELSELKEDIDYIVHAASMTSSLDFVNRPVEVISSGFLGTKNILEIAKKNKIEGMVYLSSMEVYGNPIDNSKINETFPTNLDTMNVRSCYPESKRICEALCKAYEVEYDLPINALRLTQTFGPGVKFNDQRVFAEFARCAIEGKDIVLHTKGETMRSYLHVEDAVDAIFTVLLSSKRGEVFNAANEDTYCSIYEMADFVLKNFSNSTNKVVIEEGDIQKYGYAKTLKMNLDTRKLQELGWNPKNGLYEMYEDMIKDMTKQG